MTRAVRHPGLYDACGACLPGRLLDIAGCEAYVVDAPALSPGSSPPVALLHGYGDTADCWRRVVPALQRNRRVIAIDIPPFGRSGRHPAFGEDPMRTYAEFFPALFDALGVERATIVGHSMGGAMGLTFALEAPERVERLVLIAPAGLGDHAPWWWHAISGRWINWPALLRLPNPVARPAVKTALRSFLEDRLVHDARAMGEVIDHFVHLHGGPQELRHLIETGRALMQGYTGTLLGRSAELEMPVLMLWGRQDRLAPAQHAQDFRRVVAHARVEVFDHCGHYPQLELPARLTATIREFLDEQRAPVRRKAAEPVAVRRTAAGV